MDLTTITSSTLRVRDNTINQNVPGQYNSLSQDGATIYFVPAAPLANGRTYTINVNTAASGLTDVTGISIGGYNFTFTTGIGPSAAAPAVLSITPPDGLTLVPINARVAIQWNEPINGQSIGQVALTTGGVPVPVTRTLTNGNQTLILTPAATLRLGTTYTVRISGVTDFSGRSMEALFTSTFTTGSEVDFASPTVLVADPANGLTRVPTNAVVRIRFNKRMVVTNANIRVYPISVGVNVNLSGVVAMSSDGLTATFTPTSVLLPTAQYGVYLSGVTDLTGQVLTGGNATYTTFTTGDGVQSTAPTISMVTPPNAATGVPVNAVIQGQLTSPIAAATVGAGAIRVTPSGGVPISGTLSVTNGNTVLAFAPTLSLAPSTSYTVTVGGFSDLTGTPIAQVSASFTTAGIATPDSVRPAVTSVAPLNGATAVQVTGNVTLTFNEAVNPLTVTSATIPLRANGFVLAGTYSVSKYDGGVCADRSVPRRHRDYGDGQQQWGAGSRRKRGPAVQQQLHDRRDTGYRRANCHRRDPDRRCFRHRQQRADRDYVLRVDQPEYRCRVLHRRLLQQCGVVRERQPPDVHAECVG